MQCFVVEVVNDKTLHQIFLGRPSCVVITLGFFGGISLSFFMILSGLYNYFVPGLRHVGLVPQHCFPLNEPFVKTVGFLMLTYVALTTVKNMSNYKEATN